MLAQRTDVLISYNDKANPSDKRDRNIADQVASYLQNKGVESEIRGYSSTLPDIGGYQWLILVSSSFEAMRSSPVASTVDQALKQVVERDMAGVLLVTTSSADSLELWPTIRKYDVSDQEEMPGALEGVWYAIQSAKKPYIAPPALVSRRSQFAARFASSPQSNMSLSIKPATLLITILCTILLSLAGVITFVVIKPFSPPPTPTATTHRVTPAQATATAQAVALQAYQTLYNEVIGKQNPTVVGFRQSEKWDTNNTCAFDQNKAYHAKISKSQSGTYILCMAQKSDFADFAYQVALTIQGDAGGIIFRSDKNGSYYRFSLKNNDPTHDTFNLYFCTLDQCNANATNQGMSVCDGRDVAVQPNQPVTLTVIAQGSHITLYINQKFVCQAKNVSAAPLLGAIGVYAASLGNDTDVMISDPRVWEPLIPSYN